MYQHKFALAACLLTAVAGTSVMAQSVSAHFLAFANSSAETPRVLNTVDANQTVTLARSHFAFIDQMKAASVVDAATPMNHLQLVLKRSAARQAALDQLNTDQHNPNSPRYRQWLTPKQYGQQFGVLDSDIAAASAWLTSQGFTVNAVYPNRMQIDFSGTAGMVDAAFHTEEMRYESKDGGMHSFNAHDVSVPAALASLIAGVSGISDFQPKRPGEPKKYPRYDAGLRKPSKQVIQYVGNPRLLVPNDIVTIYGVRKIRDNGVVGTGVTIAVIEGGGIDASSWNDFSNRFNLARYGGTLTQTQPPGPSFCAGVTDSYEDTYSLADSEWTHAVAPGANIVLAICENDDGSGFYAAASNLINGEARPNVIDANYSIGEFFTSKADKLMIDNLWAQADVEGISVFVATGNNGSGQGGQNQFFISGYPGVDANALATSPNVTAVGGTDFADRLDGTTAQYFASTPSSVGGSALSYVPEIPWNNSCGNGVVAKTLGYNRVEGYCNALLRNHQTTYGWYAAGGGISMVDRKPSWQSQVYNAEMDRSRDVPDVVAFAGSYDGNMQALICGGASLCTQEYDNYLEGVSGTSLSSAIFAGIQALMDQGLAARGFPIDQGNAAPILYALAKTQFGGPAGTAPASLSVCNADHGNAGTDNCIFHNVTRGSISTPCEQVAPTWITPNCYFYSTKDGTDRGLTTIDANPTSYGVSNKAYGARAGWSFASGLGSVNATNLLIAWRAFDNEYGPAHPYSPSQPAQAVDLY